ncbi:MAG: hypothetical protein ACRCTS_10280 [Fusobacteriaceae bacterium]
MISTVENICNQNKIPYRFEIEPNSDPFTLSHLTFMGALGGIYIRSCDIATNEEIINIALHDNNPNNFISNIKYMKLIVEAMGNKYIQTKKLLNKIDSVVILPGSNILNITVDFDAVTAAVNNGAYVKPHPYTTAEDIFALKKRYGNRVLGKDYSGCDIIKTSKRVYSTGASELAIYSIVLGKTVMDIGNKNSNTRGGYCAIFNELIKLPHYMRPIALKKILSHKMSGIFFPFDYAEKNIENFILENF